MAIDANRDVVAAAVEEAAGAGAELLLLPELWSTGLLGPAHARQAASGTPELADMLAGLCRRYHITVAGGMPELQGNSKESVIFNTTFVTGPDGIIAKYRKINLFCPMGEDRVFSPGNRLCLFPVPGHTDVLAGLMTCFDLRFPEIARRLAWHGAQIILVSALWPMVRRDHFDLLLKARAVENQCFAAASNACGLSGSTELAGSSAIIDPAGRTLCRAGNHSALLVHDIDFSAVSRVRKRFISVHPPRHWACRDEKFLPVEKLIQETHTRKQAGQQMVFTNGCFDIIHAGHIAYLEEARRQGDFLVVGLNSDRSVRKIKGSMRPINTQEMRARVLSGLQCIDYVTVFDESTPEKLINSLMPDVLVKGADWAEDRIIGADTVKAAGGRVVRIPFTYDTSTSGTIEKIRNGVRV